ncbi:MAG TPA: alpha/beta hydrolase-fold protein [Dongiaceae bacterium]|nr:alpha/beta hydrolase-fold protein [Dongiaceae bacterium]
MKIKILSQPHRELFEFKRPASNPEHECRCSGFLRIPAFGISRVLGAAVLVMVLGLAGPASAQRLLSPEVQSDGRVSFRLMAPEAKAVLVHCEGVKASEMQKDEQGVWSLTTEPLEPDIYAYSFAVDGVHCIDPANPLLKYNLLNTDSQVRVPGPATLAWEINDVPHGRLHRHFYHSAIAADDRDFYVYTPPGYEPGFGKRYPVLYLLHGYSDDATAWVGVGCAHIILDNLIARKQAKPMIVVMPLGYGTMEVVRGGWGGVRRADVWQENLDKFRQTLLDEVMPQVEKAYRTLPTAKARAIAGLSMGGSESLLAGLNALDRFAWVGAFSSGGLGTNLASQFPALDEKANSQLRLLWLGCGEQDGLLPANQKLSEWLNSKGIRHTWVHTPGQHSFRIWRRYLAQYAPLLFQQKEQP